MKAKSLFIFFLGSFLFTACEKSASFKLDEAAPKLVVEATIENGQPAVVYLSKSLGYFSLINQSILANSFVHNAEVYVSNGTLTHKLKEYIVPIGGGYNFYYYSIDSSNLTTAFVGQLNKTYSLRIVWDGKEYAATTHIPNITRHIDSLFWRQSPGVIRRKR